jgi:hypothetical protein
LGVLLPGLFEQREIGVGVFPESEDGFVLLTTLRGFVLQCVGSRETEMGVVIKIDHRIDSWIGEDRFVLLFGCPAIFDCKVDGCSL